MKHASAETIERLTSLLTGLRAIQGLQEKRPGVFYRKSRAFLHFHEHGIEVYADLRVTEPDFTRLPVSSSAQQLRLLKQVRAIVDSA